MSATRSALLAALLLVAPLSAQEAERAAETQALRVAGALESRGQLMESEAVLRQLLGEQPGSVGALFALARVLGAQGRLVDVLPIADHFLAVDPAAPGVGELKLRVLLDADSVDALARETEVWIARQPGSPAPYRNAAPLWERAFGPERALDLLRRGRAAIGEPAALALEIGDLLARTGKLSDAAAEWARTLDQQGAGAEGIVRRVAQIDDRGERARLVDLLMESLGRGSTTVSSRVLAVELGVTFERTDRALGVASGLVPELSRPDRRAFLEDLGRWGDDAGAEAVTLWALTQLREVEERGEEARALDARIARVALSVGDTAAALAAGGRLADGLPKGSVERRRVLADRIRVLGTRAHGEEIFDRLQEFRAEFPEAPEGDELSALVASGLQSRGQSERAAALIADEQGPESSMERAYLVLDGGDVAAGRAALMAAVEGLLPARATEAIQLAALLGRLSEPGAAAVARAAVAARRGSGREAALTLEAAVPSLAPSDRPSVLAEAARLAERAGAPADAARTRGALVEAHPDAPEAAEAALALARWHARTPAGVAVAVRLLEDLIVRAPDSAVAPAARRELERLRRSS